MILKWVVTAVAVAIMVLFSSQYFMRWKLVEIYVTAKKKMDSLERKWEEQNKTTKKEIASLNRKLEVMETCKLILEEQKNKYILISDAITSPLTEIKSMASRTGLDPQEIKDMCRNLENKQDEILEILGRISQATDVQDKC
ncbi:hypothetical protein ISN45_Aa01g033230 [Arabidopsis thaliana x Arabidopsis arenosa]|uniref:Uncharacterized protein n=1 Tax=Arabidopsis thaliana x Arabidopsis arenosa TaxID=1240361 RepID=A0A8T2C8G1_9BRAS|nr:hypothetical protein ISN45_Aa01g033230 [Arabidopsis thaliana x Arabidopsis arenosa]